MLVFSVRDDPALFNSRQPLCLFADFPVRRACDEGRGNRKTETAHPPRRGIIMDKNGEVLATNDPIYTLEITPAKTPNFNQTIKELQKVISISKGDIRRFNRLKDELPRLSPVPVKSGLTDEEVARFTAQSWRFPGVEVRSRMHRFYPAGKDAAHVVGYIGRISQRDQTRLKRAAEETITRGHSISAKRVLSFRTKTYCTASPDSSKSRYALPAARSDLYR